MRTFAVSLVCSVLMVGCASTYTVGTKESGADYDLEELNERTEKQECTVVLTTGEEKKVKEIMCATDSVSWITSIRISTPRSLISRVQQTSWIGSTRCSIPTSSLSSIRMTNAGAGAMDGLAPGTLVGLSAGLVVLGVLNTAFGGGTIPAQGYLTSGAGGAAGGALLGALIGAIIGHTDKYIIE